jgi:hypothetical protein
MIWYSTVIMSVRRADLELRVIDHLPLSTAQPALANHRREQLTGDDGGEYRKVRSRKSPLVGSTICRVSRTTS